MNEKLKIKVKKTHPDAVIPTQALKTDAGYDLVAVADATLIKSEFMYIPLYAEYDTGIAVEPPTGYHVEVYPRSSISKTGLILANGIGLIDSDYRGTIKLRFKVANASSPYRKGDKIGQLVIKKTIHADFEEVKELSDTNRGSGGFGSTGS